MAVQILALGAYDLVNPKGRVIWSSTIEVSRPRLRRHERISMPMVGSGRHATVHTRSGSDGDVDVYKGHSAVVSQLVLDRLDVSKQGKRIESR